MALVFLFRFGLGKVKLFLGEELYREVIVAYPFLEEEQVDDDKYSGKKRGIPTNPDC